MVIYSRRFYRSTPKIVFLFGALFLLSHCAGKGQAPKEDERTLLKARISEYWFYQVQGQVEQAYSFVLPAYREQHTIFQFANRFKMVRYLEADVLDVEINGEEAKANVLVTYKLLTARYFSTIEHKRNFEENWVKINHVWYHVPAGFEMTKK